jgi:AcrR family transcriptional regulator
VVDATQHPTAQRRRGGRGARERILAAVADLFYREGIHATGVARVAEVAEVSIRTLYQHFASKDDLVLAYLRQFRTDRPIVAESQLLRTELPPRERLLAIFPPLAADHLGVARGCPFHNAAVEAAGAMPAVSSLVAEHKAAFRDLLIDTARQAGIRDAESAGRQLAVLYEGAAALSASGGDRRVVDDALTAATTLVDAALGASRR